MYLKLGNIMFDSPPHSNLCLPPMVDLPSDVLLEITRWACSPWSSLKKSADDWPSPEATVGNKYLFLWQLSLRTVNHTFYSLLVPPFPSASVIISSPASLEALFLAVINFEHHLCKCGLQEQSKHHPFLQVAELCLEHSAGQSWDHLGSLANQALPYMCLRGITISIDSLTTGLTLSLIAGWWPRGRASGVKVLNVNPGSLLVRLFQSCHISYLTLFSSMGKSIVAALGTPLINGSIPSSCILILSLSPWSTPGSHSPSLPTLTHKPTSHPHTS